MAGSQSLSGEEEHVATPLAFVDPCSVASRRTRPHPVRASRLVIWDVERIPRPRGIARPGRNSPGRFQRTAASLRTPAQKNRKANEMNRRITLAACEILMLTWPGFAQSVKTVGARTAMLNGGLTVLYSTVADPSFTPSRDFRSFVSSPRDSLRHYLFNGSSYFGYELKAEPVGNGRLRLTFGPLPGDVAKQLQWANAKDAVVLSPKFPAPQIVEDGQSVELDLLVSPDGKQRITDKIEVHLPKTKAKSISQPGPTSDTVQMLAIRSERDGDQINLSGKVLISTREFSVSADEATYDTRKGEIIPLGHVVVKPLKSNPVYTENSPSELRLMPPKKQ